MRHVIAVAICGLSLGACTSNDLFKLDTKPTPVTLQIESEPSGAEARLPTGEACTTPCSLPVTGPGEVAVSFALAGYTPTTAQVTVIRPADPAESTHADPNPLQVQLEKAAPPPKKRRPVRRSRKPSAAKPAATRPAARPAPEAPSAPPPAAEPAPPPQAAPAPAPTAPSPWPPAPGQPPAQQ